MSSQELIKLYRDVIDEHRKWLTTFPQHHRTRWEAELAGNGTEGAICEAWMILYGFVDLLQYIGKSFQ